MKTPTRASFTKVATPGFTKKSSLIAEQILTSIKIGSYPPGSRLPAERLIAEQMNVGRPAVREAISALQISGVLESRPGDGTYVAAELPPGMNGETGIAVLEESDSPFEALQARKAMEIGVVYLAVACASDEDIRRIQRVWARKRKMAMSGNYRGFIEHGRDFHLAIAEATGSRADRQPDRGPAAHDPPVAVAEHARAVLPPGPDTPGPHDPPARRHGPGDRRARRARRHPTRPGALRRPDRAALHRAGRPRRRRAQRQD